MSFEEIKLLLREKFGEGVIAGEETGEEEDDDDSLLDQSSKKRIVDDDDDFDGPLDDLGYENFDYDDDDDY